MEHVLNYSALITEVSAAIPTTESGMIWIYSGFVALVLVFLALDLGVFHRNAHDVSVKEAATWSVIWTACAIAFTVFVYFAYESHWMGLGQSVPVVGHPGEWMVLDGATAAEQFLAGYIVEWSLSVDNLFVIAVVFSYFAVPSKYQHRVLFWGILGALVMRGVMIALGAVLLAKFGWITYVFGGFLILTAVKMAFAGHEAVHPDRNILVRAVRAIWPVSSQYDDDKFFARIAAADGVLKRAATPLLLAIVVVEFTDVVFAVDSVPAIFAITGDPFIVFTSNVFAILGLRSLYFLLAKLLGTFRYLKHALVLILGFVGVKMLLVHSEMKIGTGVSLMVVVGLLAAGVGASILYAKIQARRKAPLERLHTPVEDLAEAFAVGRRNFRKVLILIAGTAVVLFGIVIAPLPGPGPVVLVPIGLAILATEFIWAQRLLKKLKETTEEMGRRGDAAGAKLPKLFLIPIVAGFYVFFTMLYLATHLPKSLVIGSALGLSLPLWIWVYRVLTLVRDKK